MKIIIYFYNINIIIVFFFRSFYCLGLREATSFLESGSGSHYLIGRQYFSYNMGCDQKADLLEFFDIDGARDFFHVLSQAPFI